MIIKGNVNQYQPRVTTLSDTPDINIAHLSRPITFVENFAYYAFAKY